ncbi:MAG TPA: SusD/RagB family nutrient-binding outer membrane lipoprotein [Mucilaginibacter sp.]|jgi:hypothetical protein|nr:SusD/RagB family nutrient-binding outer membrane lipoprotein [Mucilaginibacter sp.]
MKKITILIFAIAVLGAGCKRFIDINQNVNQPLSVTPNVVLSAALTGSAGNLAGNFLNSARWMGYWARSGNYIADVPTETYVINAGYADGDFQSLYGTLSRYAYIEKAAQASKSTLPFYLGVAKTMKALHFSTLVDGFGNVPYSQAFQVNTNSTPAYDDAASIYSSLVSQLDSAITYFEAAKAYYSASTTVSSVLSTDDKYDVMFGRGTGGTSSTNAVARMVKWEEFANTIKLKLLLHESELSSVKSGIAAELAKTSSFGYLPAGTSAAINPGYSTSVSQFNPYWGIFNSASGQSVNYAFFRCNQYSVNYLNSVGDNTRLNLFYAITGAAVVGAYDGDPQAPTNSITAGIGTENGTGVLKGSTQDQPILMDFESLFLQAEATAKGYITGGATPDALVKQAIEQNYIYLGDNAADADAYYAANSTNPTVSYTASVGSPVSSTSVDPTPGMQAIMTQKWAALNGINWFEAFTENRRTGFPLKDGKTFGVSHAPNPILHNGAPTIPYRFLYPQSEINSNGKNVPALPAAQYTPIFWDVFDK